MLICLVIAFILCVRIICLFVSPLSSWYKKEAYSPFGFQLLTHRDLWIDLFVILNFPVQKKLQWLWEGEEEEKEEEKEEEREKVGEEKKTWRGKGKNEEED